MPAADATAAAMIETPDWADEREQRLLKASLPHAVRVGWNRLMMAGAARDCGFTGPEAELLLPHGARDLAALMAQRHDRIALEALADFDPASLKVRERIRIADLQAGGIEIGQGLQG